MDLVVVDGHENHAVLAQQVAAEVEAGPHHAQPGRVVLAALAGVFLPEVLLVEEAVFVALADGFFVVLAALPVVVRVHEGIGAGVVGRVDVNHLHLAEVAALEHAQHFQVLAFDEHVAGVVPVHRVFGVGQQGGGGGALHLAAGGAFAGPAQLVVVGAGGGQGIGRAQGGPQALEIHAPFAHHVGEELVEPGNVFGGDVETAAVHEEKLMR